MSDRFWVLALLLAGLLLGGPAAAAVCPQPLMPEGYRASCEQAGEGPGWELRIRPEGEVPDPLTSLTVWPVDAPIPDPEAWLRRQVTLNMADFTGSLRDTLRYTDNPWIPPALVDSLETLTEYARSLDELPLRGCGPAERRDEGDLWEMSCAWELGPFTQFALLRLVRDGDRTIAQSAWATSDRRLRHLIAIANSFRIGESQ
jgi:hypothetical protein